MEHEIGHVQLLNRSRDVNRTLWLALVWGARSTRVWNFWHFGCMCVLCNVPRRLCVLYLPVSQFVAFFNLHAYRVWVRFMSRFWKLDAAAAGMVIPWGMVRSEPWKSRSSKFCKMIVLLYTQFFYKKPAIRNWAWDLRKIKKPSLGFAKN